MNDQQIEEEVARQVFNDSRKGRSILISSLIGLFGPLVIFFSKSPAMTFLIVPLAITYFVLVPLSVAGLFAANVLLDPARKNILETRIRKRESQGR